MTPTAPTFSLGARPGLVCSLIRSAGAAMVETEWEAGPGLLPLWWGPTVPVGPGDVLSYFVAPGGLAFEGVVGKEAA